ncbi:unnamed protein product [Peniophora sp. CBMAI 1063]|nr:unnamed protein product [Peniophora sp. CBMAI 1063]
MARTLAFGFAVGFLVVLALVIVISLRPNAWSRSARANTPSISLYMPRPRTLNLQAHFGTLRRLPNSPTRSTFSASSEESEESYEKTAVKHELSASYDSLSHTKPAETLSMLAAVPGHILALITSPVPLRSRRATASTAPTVHLSFPNDVGPPRPARALPVIHRRHGAISLARPPPPKSTSQRPDSLQSFESPSVYSQMTTAVTDDVPTIMVSAPSCPTLEVSEVGGREGRMLGPQGYYF